MALPQSVKQAAEAADNQIRALAEQRANGGQPQEEPTLVVMDEEEGQQGDQPAVPVQQEMDLGTPEPDSNNWKAESEKWEQRYRSLDGMIKARDRQIEQLHALIAGMQQPPKEEPKESKPTSLVSEKDIDAFGADYIDLARRVAREENATYVQQLEQQLAELKGQVGNVSKSAALSAQERFENALGTRVSNWRTTDSNPKFIDWLNASPVRQRMFSEAAQAHDVEGIAYFYETFAPVQAPAAAPVATAKSKLEKQIAPGKTKSVQAPTSDSEGKTWTRSEISSVYGNKKQYSAEEFSKIEREIAAAQREGRVDYNR